MSNGQRPVLSVIVRRFRPEVEDDITQSLKELQAAAAQHPGYLGDQNSLSHGADFRELVSVFVFDTRENLEAWERSAVRLKHIAILDRHPQEPATQLQFDDLAALLPPASRISKIEVVAILIFWIVLVGGLLGSLADMVLPASFPALGRTLLTVPVSVTLISYILLPWSSRILTRLKGRFSRPKRAG